MLMDRIRLRVKRGGYFPTELVDIKESADSFTVEELMDALIAVDDALEKAEKKHKMGSGTLISTGQIRKAIGSTAILTSKGE